MKETIKTPILITGASGFIGSNLTRHLISKGLEVNLIIKSNSNTWRINDIINYARVYTTDLSNKKNINSIVKKIKPKTIFHLATYGAYPFQKELGRIKLVNLDSTINLLRACEDEGFNIFINTGSNSEYGIKNNAMKETDILEPNSYYSVFKSAATLFCQYEANSKQLPIVTLRPFHVYGPYEENTRLLPILITNLLKNKCPPLVSPDIKRDMIFIDDAIDLYTTVAKKKGNIGKIFNMGSGIEYTIKEIVCMAIDITGSTVSPKWNTMKKRLWDHNKWKADMTIVKNTFNWEPKYNLFQGLSQTINWYKNSLDNIVNQ